MSADTLHDLSTLAVQAPLAASTLSLAAQVLRVGAGAEEVHLVYVPAEEFCWASDPPSDERPTNDGGLRHVQRRLMALGVPLAFNVGEGGRIADLGVAREAHGCRWLALPVPGRGNFTDMLIVRGAWSDSIPDEVLCLLEASLPALAVLIGRLVDASQVSRQREQLNALSEVARAITQTHEMEAVLTRLATVIASLADYEIVILDVLDEDRRKIRLRCQNESRWSGSTQTRATRQSAEGHELEPRYQEVVRTRQTALFPDLQHDERVSPEQQEWFRRVLMVSSAVVPLCFGDEVLGFLVVSSPRPHDFPPEDVRLLEGLAAQAAAAIKAIQNYEELEASREQLREYAERLRESVEIQRRLARTDALTGIANRRYVEEFLAAQCARSHRDGSPLAVVLVDVDNLKQINDTLGHASGDQALIELARVGRATCRTMDVMGRYGGDEFIFVLPLADLEHAARFAERLRGRVARRRLRLNGDAVVRVTLSLGVSEFSSQRTDPDTILQSADEALYRAKAEGKNRACVAEDRVPAA